MPPVWVHGAARRHVIVWAVHAALRDERHLPVLPCCGANTSHVWASAHAAHGHVPGIAALGASAALASRSRSRAATAATACAGV